MKKTVIIEYGAGNVFSVEAAARRLGYDVNISCEPDIIMNADRVIFPGVGHAGFAMERLKKNGLNRIIPKLTAPVLGICLGMQLMCSRSEESDTEGLGIFPQTVKQIKGDCKVPHIGWNQISALDSPLFEGVKNGAWVYFVHSYYLETSDYQVAECDYHTSFCAAIQKDNFFGCQFHPEKSGKTGERILKNFLE